MSYLDIMNDPSIEGRTTLQAMRRRSLRSAVLLSLSLALAACGGEDPDANNTNNNSEGLDWANLDANERAAYMTTAVLPRMAMVFQSYDAERYAAFSCETCHGAAGASSGYAMPNPSLPALPADIEVVFTNNSTAANFMLNQVVPELASLLELEPVDPATGEGDIGCFTCHTMQ